GWGYFVESGPYREFCKGMGDQNEMCTCTGLSALDHANTKYSSGYRATGVGMCTCARHEIVMKNGVGDLQRGERYSNMDYIFASALRHFTSLLRLLISYDIVCQWSKKLVERLRSLPPFLRLDGVLKIVAFVIPKLHILGHTMKCQRTFNLSYTRGAGQSDGEGIERIWSGSGLLGTSTREMGPGSRQNTCEDYWHHWNWRKVIGLGTLLLKRMKNALKEFSRQKSAFKIFAKNQAKEAPEWMKMVDDFEQKKTDFNPFELPKTSLTLQDIRAQFADEDRINGRLAHDAGDELGLDDNLTPSQYIFLLLEVEEQQRQLALDVRHERSPSKKQRDNFLERRTRIEKQIVRVRALQKTHCPEAIQLLTTRESDGLETLAEHTTLVFPSELPASRRNLNLASIESKYRDGQCSSSLDSIRHGLLVKRRLYTYKTNHVRKQKQSARSRTLLDNHQRKIDLAVSTYRHAWSAKCRLVGEESVGWHKLLQEDVRMLEDEEEERRKDQRPMKSRRKEAALVNEHGGIKGIEGAGESRRLISWIWVAADGQTGLPTDQALYDGKFSVVEGFQVLTCI
ncbi:hypothetical protein EV361DRAFT_801298, partial [Lentinula raphanica]